MVGFLFTDFFEDSANWDYTRFAPLQLCLAYSLSEGSDVEEEISTSHVAVMEWIFKGEDRNKESSSVDRVRGSPNPYIEWVMKSFLVS